MTCTQFCRLVSGVLIPWQLLPSPKGKVADPIPRLFLLCNCYMVLERICSGLYIGIINNSNRKWHGVLYNNSKQAKKRFKTPRYPEAHTLPLSIIIYKTNKQSSMEFFLWTMPWLVHQLKLWLAMIFLHSQVLGWSQINHEWLSY